MKLDSAISLAIVGISLNIIHQTLSNFILIGQALDGTTMIWAAINFLTLNVPLIILLGALRRRLTPSGPKS